MTAVIAILAFVAAVVLPKYVALSRGQSSRDFQSALVDLAADARIFAIETGRTVRVTYQDDRQAIVISSVDPVNFETLDERVIPLIPNLSLSSFTVEGLFSTSADWMIEFHPDGTGNDAGIEVDEGGRIYSVRFSGETGASTKTDDVLEEIANEEWQAGEIERRI